MFFSRRFSSNCVTIFISLYISSTFTRDRFRFNLKTSHALEEEGKKKEKKVGNAHLLLLEKPDFSHSSPPSYHNFISALSSITHELKSLEDMASFTNEFIKLSNELEYDKDENVLIGFLSGIIFSRGKTDELFFSCFIDTMRSALPQDFHFIIYESLYYSQTEMGVEKVNDFLKISKIRRELEKRIKNEEWNEQDGEENNIFEERNEIYEERNEIYEERNDDNANNENNTNPTNNNIKIENKVMRFKSSNEKEKELEDRIIHLCGTVEPRDSRVDLVYYKPQMQRMKYFYFGDENHSRFIIEWFLNIYLSLNMKNTSKGMSNDDDAADEQYDILEILKFHDISQHALGVLISIGKESDFYNKEMKEIVEMKKNGKEGENREYKELLEGLLKKIE